MFGNVCFKRRREIALTWCVSNTQCATAVVSLITLIRTSHAASCLLHRPHVKICTKPQTQGCENSVWCCFILCTIESRWFSHPSEDCNQKKNSELSTLIGASWTFHRPSIGKFGSLPGSISLPIFCLNTLGTLMHARSSESMRVFAEGISYDPSTIHFLFLKDSLT